MMAQYGLQCLVDQCRLTAATDSRYNDEFPQGEGGIDMLQVIAAGTMEGKDVVVVSFVLRCDNIAADRSFV